MAARITTAIHKALIAAAGGLLVSLGSLQPGLAGEAIGDTINLTIDFAKIVNVDAPVATIVIGNSGIADAALGDETTIVLTGKAAGTTNLIVLDQAGGEIAHATVHVASDTRHLTTIFRGKERQTLSCAPTCEQVIAVGDEPTAFTEATSQIQARQSFSGIGGGGDGGE
jgi:Flp pilus assembly secretin CpaC